jgi:hypothetical protein
MAPLFVPFETIFELPTDVGFDGLKMVHAPSEVAGNPNQLQ